MLPRSRPRTFTSRESGDEVPPSTAGYVIDMWEAR